jgi:hypothetical protein
MQSMRTRGMELPHVRMPGHRNSPHPTAAAPALPQATVSPTMIHHLGTHFRNACYTVPSNKMPLTIYIITLIKSHVLGRLMLGEKSTASRTLYLQRRMIGCLGL